jgi:hypothetical protein
MQSGWREHNTASLNVQENQDKGITEALHGQNPLPKEIGLPQAGRMPIDELVPRRSTSFGARIEPIFLENVADRTFGFRPNPQLPEFTHNPGIAPFVFICQLDEQLAALLSRAPPSPLRNSKPLLGGPLVLPNPAQEGTRCDDRDELIDGSAEFGSEPQQPLSFFGRNRDACWELYRTWRASSFWLAPAISRKSDRNIETMGSI